MNTDRSIVNALLIDYYDESQRAAHTFLDLAGAKPSCLEAGRNVIRTFETPNTQVRCKVVDWKLAAKDETSVAWAFSGIDVVVPLLDGTVSSPEIAVEQGAAIRINMDLAYQKGIRNVIALFNLVASQFSEQMFQEISRKIFQRLTRIGFDAYHVECIPVGFSSAFGETFSANIDHPSSETDFRWYHGRTALEHFDALAPSRSGARKEVSSVHG